jgi:phosphoglycolate phosphatase
MLDQIVVSPLKTAILSNKPDDFTKMCVRDLLPRWEFGIVLGNRNGFSHKPDPAAALEIVERLGVSPASVLLIGDSGVDVETAINAGMYPAGVTWGYRSREELTASGARTLFDRPQDIIDFLDSPARG